MLIFWGEINWKNYKIKFGDLIWEYWFSLLLVMSYDYREPKLIANTENIRLNLYW